MGRVDDILELIDGALADGMSPDAVRWTPDKPAEVMRKGEPDLTVWRSDAYEATLLAYGEFSNSERQAHGRFTDITDC